MSDMSEQNEIHFHCFNCGSKLVDARLAFLACDNCYSVFLPTQEEFNGKQRMEEVQGPSQTNEELETSLLKTVDELIELAESIDIKKVADDPDAIGKISRIQKTIRKKLEIVQAIIPDLKLRHGVCRYVQDGTLTLGYDPISIPTGLEVEVIEHSKNYKVPPMPNTEVFIRHLSNKPHEHIIHSNVETRVPNIECTHGLEDFFVAAEKLGFKKVTILKWDLKFGMVTYATFAHDGTIVVK